MNPRSASFGIVLWTVAAAVFFLPRPSLPQDATAVDGAYAVFSNSGETFTVRELAESFVSADVILAGELHGHAPGHAFQQHFLAALISAAERHGRRVVLSMEMFERDVQPVLDEYLAGLIRERELLRDARPWPNYATDYRPLVELAKDHDIPVVAANVPRRYAALVAREGLEGLAGLPEAAEPWLPALPVSPPSEAYARKFRAYMERAAHPAPVQPSRGDTAAAHPPQHPHAANVEYLLQAQVLKDAAMAEAIQGALGRFEDAVVFHINGAFHSDERLGVVEYLKRENPALALVTFTTVATEYFPELNADFQPDAADFFVVTAVGSE